MIDRSKFLEPTEKYLREFSDRTPKQAKDWYNVDLIFFAVQWKNADYKEAVGIQLGYDKFCKYYDITLTMGEINKYFGEYPKDSFDELMKELVQKAIKEELI